MYSNDFANDLCILIFAKKSLKNFYPAVWQMSFAFWFGLAYMSTVYCAWHYIAPHVFPPRAWFPCRRRFLPVESWRLRSFGSTHRCTSTLAVREAIFIKPVVRRYVRHGHGHPSSMCIRFPWCLGFICWYRLLFRPWSRRHEENFCFKKTVGSTLWVLSTQFCQTIRGNLFFFSLYWFETWQISYFVKDKM